MPTTRVRLTRVPAVAALALVLPLVLAGCGSDDPSTVAGPDTSTAPTSTAPTSTAPSAAPVTSAAPSTAAATAAPSAGVRTVALTVVGGKVTGDTGRAKVEVGETVDVAVNADVAEEVHIHGYDLMVDTVPGQTVHKVFVAKITGIFEIELEQSKLQLTRLQVQ